MSAPDPETAFAPIPEVPSTARLAWLLFMQPRKLHREFTAWVGENDFIFFSDRWKAGDPHLRHTTRGPSITVCVGFRPDQHRPGRRVPVRRPRPQLRLLHADLLRGCVNPSPEPTTASLAPAPSS